MAAKRLTALKKCLAAAVSLAAAGGIAVESTTSTFTDSSTRTQTVTSGTFVFNLSDPVSTSAFSVGISGMAPGDFADRLVDVANGGSINFASVALAVTTPVTSSLLDTDAVNGLKMQVDSCSAAWVQASSSVAATCGGTTTALTPLTAISSLKAAGPSYTGATLAALTAGGSDHLRFHYSLPAASAGTAGISSAMVFTFTATQVAGGAYH